MMLSGTQHTISAGPYQAVITEQGGGLRTLTRDGHDLILSHDPDQVTPSGFGQLLAPWPNRIDRGKYVFEGVENHVAVNEPARDCAIHGLVRWDPWTLEEQAEDSVRLSFRLLGQPGYPYRLDLSVTYALDAEEGLTVRLSAHNAGGRTAPYGQSTHPYLTVGLPLDACEVEFGGAEYQPVDERLIPAGPPLSVEGTLFDLRAAQPFGDRKIDTAYTGLPFVDGRVWVRLSGGGRTTALWADEAHPWLQLYTADDPHGSRAGLAAEPMTCPPDAFNSGIDLISLKPDDTFTSSWGIQSQG